MSKGMECPVCSEDEGGGVSDSRATATTVRRRRFCKNRHRWTTYEILERPQSRQQEIRDAVRKVLSEALKTVAYEK